MARGKKKPVDGFMVFTLAVCALALTASLWAGLLALELFDLRQGNTLEKEDLAAAVEYLVKNRGLIATDGQERRARLRHDRDTLHEHIKKCGNLVNIKKWPRAPKPESKRSEPQEARAEIRARGGTLVPFIQKLESLRTMSYIHKLKAIRRQSGRTGEEPGPADWDVSIMMKSPDSLADVSVPRSTIKRKKPARKR